MALREEFVRSGNWLFRRRSYLPLLLFIPTLLSMRHFAYPDGRHMLDRLWEAFCLLLSLGGLGIRAAVVGHTPEGTSGRNTRDGQVASELNTTGLYSVVRHPLYVGNFLMWYGVALFARSWWLAAFTPLVFWLYYERIMFAEEEFLRGKFGTAYLEWAERTPAFLPRLSTWQAPSLPLSIRTILKREYSGIFAIVASFTLLDAVSETIALGHPHVDPMWAVIFLVGLVIYVTLRTLKRHTVALHVQGR
jgi:protein-S-isoprenylcysteine O-methyltransferase Ste14